VWRRDHCETCSWLWLSGTSSTPATTRGSFFLRGRILRISFLRNKIVNLLYCTTANNNTLQRHNTENSKQIFPEKELFGLSLNFHIHVSVSDIYITTIGLPVLLQENMWTDPGNTYKYIKRSNTRNVEIVTEATQFLF
jgi:hypothetical protein